MREVYDDKTQQWLRRGPAWPTGFDGFSLNATTANFPPGCSCHPDDKPPRPCPRRHAFSECRAADTARRLLRNQRLALLAAIAVALIGLGYAVFATGAIP